MSTIAANGDMPRKDNRLDRVALVNGRVPVRDLIGSLLRFVPDLHFEAKRFYVGPDHIVLEYGMSGTSDGTHFVCDGVDVIAVTDGLVARKDTYLDLVALIDQVGVLPQIAAAV